MSQPAGWYADPSGLPARRWWDGDRWTDHVQPGGDPKPPPNGYFPPVPPSGPALTEPHTVATENPEQAPLYASRAAGGRHGGPPSMSGPGPITPATHPEVPTSPYRMQPVDSVSEHPGYVASGQQGFVTAGAALSVGLAQPERNATGWRRMAGPAALAVIASLVLALTAIILLS